MKKYNLLSVECANQVGGSFRAMEIITVLVGRMFGETREEVINNTSITFELSGMTATASTTDIYLAKAILKQRNFLGCKLGEYRKHRQAKSFMIHSHHAIILPVVTCLN